MRQCIGTGRSIHDTRQHTASRTADFPSLGARDSMAAGEGNALRCHECDRIMTCAHCSPDTDYSFDSWLTIAVRDGTGTQRTLGPLHRSTLCLVVRDAAAWWKQVDRSAVSVLHGSRPLKDQETLKDSGICNGDQVTVVLNSDDLGRRQVATQWAAQAHQRVKLYCACYRCKGQTPGAGAESEDASVMEEVD